MNIIKVVSNMCALQYKFSEIIWLFCLRNRTTFLSYMMELDSIWKRTASPCENTSLERYGVETIPLIKHTVLLHILNICHINCVNNSLNSVRHINESGPRKRQSYSTDSDNIPKGWNKALSEMSCVRQTLKNLLVDVNQTLRDLRAATAETHSCWPD